MVEQQWKHSQQTSDCDTDDATLQTDTDSISITVSQDISALCFILPASQETMTPENNQNSTNSHA